MKMRVIGKGSIHFYEAADECPHAPDDEELWQESFVLYLWDTENKVFVFLRMGHAPNIKGGTASVWLNAWIPGYMYKHTDDSVALNESDRTERSLSVGNGLCRYEFDGNHNWQVIDSDYDVNIELSMEDNHPGLGYFQGDSALVRDTAKNHIEATGWVTGTVKVKDKRFRVSGIGWRDHSWGKRYWPGIRVHRFFPALFGKEFSFFNSTFIGMDGKLSRNGVLIRDDTVQFIDDFDIVAYVGEDGVSNCGGSVAITVDGKSHTLEYKPVGKSVISMNHGFACVDSMCIVSMGDKQGVGVTETSSNAQGGAEKPAVFPSSKGVILNGLYAI